MYFVVWTWNSANTGYGEIMKYCSDLGTFIGSTVLMSLGFYGQGKSWKKIVFLEIIMTVMNIRVCCLGIDLSVLLFRHKSL